MIYPPFTSKDIKKFEPHFGPVNSVCASPFNRRIFISCSSDGAIRIHDLQGEGGTLISFAPSQGEYLNCIQWSPFRAAVFACVSNLGTLYIYDMVQSKQRPIEVIKHDEDSNTAIRLR
jgi:WD repeat-containing protein 34